MKHSSSSCVMLYWNKYCNQFSHKAVKGIQDSTGLTWGHLQRPNVKVLNNTPIFSIVSVRTRPLERPWHLGVVSRTFQTECKLHLSYQGSMDGGCHFTHKLAESKCGNIGEKIQILCYHLIGTGHFITRVFTRHQLAFKSMDMESIDKKI